MVSRATFQGVAKYGQAASKQAAAFLRSGWGKAAIAAIGTGLAFSEYIYPKYTETRTAGQEADVRAEEQRTNIADRSMYAREYILERERALGTDWTGAGRTPSGQYNFSGIIVLVVIAVIGYVAIKQFGGKK